MAKFEPTKERLEELRRSMTNIQIAETEGVSLSAVKRRIKFLCIASRPLKEQPETDREKQHREDLALLSQIADVQMGRVRVAVDAGLSLMEQAKQILGRRMGEDRARGYLLDGRPASSKQVVEAAGLKFGRRRKSGEPIVS